MTSKVTELSAAELAAAKLSAAELTAELSRSTRPAEGARHTPDVDFGLGHFVECANNDVRALQPLSEAVSASKAAVESGNAASNAELPADTKLSTDLSASETTTATATSTAASARTATAWHTRNFTVEVRRIAIGHVRRSV